jgi:prepilin-type N-terminal cleavage/methylation domain-containing protein
MTNRKTKQTDGFTIIEVLIVLAIAGLIMLIVFLAVPALQRNAHNTSIKNDVSNVLGAVNEYVNNNNGSTPTTVSISGGTVTVSGAAGTNTATGKVGYLTTGSWSATGTMPAAGSAGTIVVVPGAVCNSTSTDKTTTGATVRNYVALFRLEGDAQECQQGA